MHDRARWPETRIRRSVDTKLPFAFDLPLFAYGWNAFISRYGVSRDPTKTDVRHHFVCRGRLAALCIALLIFTAQGQTVTVEHKPPDADQLAVTVGQGSDTRVAGLFSLSTHGRQTFSLQLATGDHYRLRAVAYASGSKFPLVSAFGSIPDFSVSDNGSELTLSLAPPQVHVSAQNLVGNGPGALVEITCTIEMFSDFWSANRVFFLWLSDKPLQADTAARHIITTGHSADDGSVSAKFFVPVSLTSGKTYYQCGYPLTEFSPAFATPTLIWPTVRHKAERYQQWGFNDSSDLDR